MHPVFPLRPASGDELHPEVHAASFSYHPTGPFHGHHLLHYGIGALQVQNAKDLLLQRHKYSMKPNCIINMAGMLGMHQSDWWTVAHALARHICRNCCLSPITYMENLHMIAVVGFYSTTSTDNIDVLLLFFF